MDEAEGPGALLASLRQGGQGLPATRAVHGMHGGHDVHGALDHGAPGTATSVRETTHDGHRIRIETTYTITIDGKPLEGHLEVLDNGSVHYHGLPNYAVPSAVDLVRLVIDHFGTEPPGVDELGERHP
ncbi:MAG: hypothetical protein DLM59_14645 [Pseudonocardiales bacterium]|nr:MAG: hypothetical protein DLM59_14645 [Pseudonocardiales bacterium]